MQELATRASVPECVVLSTCNRSEIYVGSSDSGRTKEDVIEFLSEFHGLPPEAFLPHLFTLEGARSGQSSVPCGRRARLGGGRRAADSGSGQGSVSCGQPSSGVWVRSWSDCSPRRSASASECDPRPPLAKGAVSVSFEAVAIAQKIFERLDGRKVLVVGAGDISKLTAQHLRTSGVGEIVITSRTAAHADALAASVGGRAVPWPEMMTALGEADIVITATGAPRPIITRAHVEAVTSRRRSDPLYIIDIAVPRDVEPSVGDIEQVFLYNIDDLQKFVQKNVSHRGAEVGRAEAIVAEEVASVRHVAAVPQHGADHRGPAASTSTRFASRSFSGSRASSRVCHQKRASGSRK